MKRLFHFAVTKNRRFTNFEVSSTTVLRKKDIHLIIPRHLKIRLMAENSMPHSYPLVATVLVDLESRLSTNLNTPKHPRRGNLTSKGTVARLRCTKQNWTVVNIAFSLHGALPRTFSSACQCCCGNTREKVFWTATSD